MLSLDSPLLNIPASLDRKQAIFLDGVRHAVQIIDLSYNRLCRSLNELTRHQQSVRGPDFTHAFLDAWSFVDTTDRFTSLWEMQPESEMGCRESCSSPWRSKLQPIRDIRNVSAHGAQKIDQIVALNSSVLGSIRWISMDRPHPPKFRSHWIRPGIICRHAKEPLVTAQGNVRFVHGSGFVWLRAGKREVNLSDAYETVLNIVRHSEQALRLLFMNPRFDERLPADRMGSVELRSFR